MSRAHMIYDNKSLNTIPVQITTWNGPWHANAIFLNESGSGYIIEGKICNKSRHTIIDGTDNSLKFRYVCLHIEVKKVTKRKFDISGKEIEPDLGQNKKVNTGYLSSSYKNASREGEDVIQPSKIVEIFRDKTLDSLLLFSKSENIVGIWCEESALDGFDLSDNAFVRLRTKGGGPYLESVVSLDKELSTKVNYSTGDSVGSSWTDKVLHIRDEKEAGHHLTSASAAVEDSEWGD